MRYSRLAALAVMLLILAALAGNAYAGAGGGRGDFTEEPTPAQLSSEYVIVTFKDPPAASYTGGIPGLDPTRPARGRFDPNSSAAQAYRRHLENVHANYRSWMARQARQAEVVREFFYTLNAVAVRRNGVSKGTLMKGPGVRSAEFSAVYHPTMNVSAGLIGASDLWSLAGGRENAGAGIKVGVVDSGIDETHPFFACKEDIPHKAYASGVVGFDPDTVIENEHGTHVAGTIAGCVITISGPVSGEISGLAPAAEVWDYNVFPGFGAPPGSPSAFSHDIAFALEDAVVDGMDVINMSLGGSVSGPHDFLAEAVNATVDAGIVVAVAAGNEGPGDMTVSSPGSAANAITAGASTNPHFIGITVTVGSLTIGAALGDFNNFDPPIMAAYTVTSPANGCTAISTDLAGKIALIDRGACTFTTKIRNAQEAGAVGVLVVNNVAGDPTAMSHDGTDPFPAIPAAMLSMNDGAAIKPDGTATVDGTTVTEFVTANADIIAGFSSRGPSPFNYLIKPDVTAPGVNVYSSVFEGEFAMFQGTSMSTPHAAGSAALLLSLHPDWSPADVKSALVNTAARTVTDQVTGTQDPGVLARGGGRIDLPAANGAPLLFNPASASFGYWSGNKDASASLDLQVRNVSGADQTCSVTVSGPPIVSASSASLSLAAGESASLSLALQAGKASQTGSGDYSGDVIVDCGGAVLRVPWWTRINRQAKP